MSKKRLNDANSEIIQENLLKENPEGIEDIEKELFVPVFKEVPQTETITFMNNRDPGIPLEFHYHSKTHPLKQYKLFHGHEYTLPIEIIDHLEGNNRVGFQTCSQAQYSYKKGPDGHPEMYITGFKNHFICKRVRRVA